VFKKRVNLAKKSLRKGFWGRTLSQKGFPQPPEAILFI